MNPKRTKEDLSAAGYVLVCQPFNQNAYTLGRGGVFCTIQAETMNEAVEKAWAILSPDAPEKSVEPQKWQKERDAFAEGRRVQSRDNYGEDWSLWMDTKTPNWYCDRFEYRIHPDDAPLPAKADCPGEQCDNPWCDKHEADDIPEGHRELSDAEKQGQWVEGAKAKRLYDTEWRAIQSNKVDGTPVSGCNAFPRLRVIVPITPAAEPPAVKEEEWVPLSAEDVPPGSAVKFKDNEGFWIVTQAVSNGLWLGIGTRNTFYDFWKLEADSDYQISRDGGATWHPCKKRKGAASREPVTLEAFFEALSASQSKDIAKLGSVNRDLLTENARLRKELEDEKKDWKKERELHKDALSQCHALQSRADAAEQHANYYRAILTAFDIEDGGVADFIHRLQGELEAAEKRAGELERERDELKRLNADLHGQILDFDTELATLRARQPSLNWKPVSEPPENLQEPVIVGSAGHAVAYMQFNQRGNYRTHYLRLCDLPLPPTEQPAQADKTREAFEAWGMKDDGVTNLTTRNGKYLNPETQLAWRAWTAATKSSRV